MANLSMAFLPSVGLLGVVALGVVMAVEAPPEALTVQPDGQVQVHHGLQVTGVIDSHEALSVDGKRFVDSTDVAIHLGDISAASGGCDLRFFAHDHLVYPHPDYVFDPDYELMPLPELADFVRRQRHLPSVPSADEVREAGLPLAESMRMHLEKIEELTLYAIDADERIRQLEAEQRELQRAFAAERARLQRQLEASRNRLDRFERALHAAGLFEEPLETTDEAP